MKIYIKHLLYILIIVFVVLLYQITDVGCPIRRFFGIPCPTCGMTRSLLSLLKFDIKGSLEYNPMTIFVMMAVWLGLHKKNIKCNNVANIIILIVAIANFITYLFRSLV